MEQQMNAKGRNLLKETTDRLLAKMPALPLAITPEELHAAIITFRKARNTLSKTRNKVPHPVVVERVAVSAHMIAVARAAEGKHQISAPFAGVAALFYGAMKNPQKTTSRKLSALIFEFMGGT